MAVEIEDVQLTVDAITTALLYFEETIRLLDTAMMTTRR